MASYGVWWIELVGVVVVLMGLGLAAPPSSMATTVPIHARAPTCAIAVLTVLAAVS